MSEAMAEIMSADDEVDALPDMGVMDCYVRAKLMKALMDKYSDWDNPEYVKGKEVLMNQSKEGVRVWAANAGMRGIVSKWAANAARDNRAEDYITEVYDTITNDDWSREKCIVVSRDYLKNYLNGSMGMPDDKVVRENMKNYEQ